MKDLLLEVINNQAGVSSRQIALHFNKRHDHVIRDIDLNKKGMVRCDGQVKYN